MPSTGTGSSLEQGRGRSLDRTGAPAQGPLAAMLAADVLAVHTDAPEAEEVRISLELDGSAAALDVLDLRHEIDSSGRSGRMLVAVLAAADLSGPATIRIDTGDQEYLLGPGNLRSLGTDLRTLLRERLAPLEAAVRAEVLELLVEAAASEPGSRDPLALGTSMALTREALREPLPPCVVERDEPQGLHFDSVIALSSTAFYLRGWARDGQAEMTRLTAVSPEGARAELLPDAFRSARPDVDSFYDRPSQSRQPETGFIAYCEMRAPSHLVNGWVLEMENGLGVVHEVPGPEVTRDVLGARAGILSDLQKERRWDTPLMAHVAPAVERIQAEIDDRVEIERVSQYGEPPANPETSIVVPLYGRVDFLEHQLAQFIHDPELRQADLIYVLDSPELEAALEAAAGQLFELYGVPFRTVVLSENGGYSIANNRGASLARGRLLLLLNSDVLPDRPGWLSELVTFFDQQEKVGAVGPKLLFEDDTLQHAGIRFQRPAGGGAWENEHYFKGLHRDLPAANVSRRVPAVSGACLLTDRALYDRLGGLRGMYVQGDYEDTDLCMRLREEGLETWYLPEVELYHLEGQSYSLETRTAMSRYNVWLHSRLWDEQIAAAMAETDATTLPQG
jgi:GT2 family glycosyltransferase